MVTARHQTGGPRPPGARRGGTRPARASSPRCSSARDCAGPPRAPALAGGRRSRSPRRSPRRPGVTRAHPVAQRPPGRRAQGVRHPGRGGLRQPTARAHHVILGIGINLAAVRVPGAARRAGDVAPARHRPRSRRGGAAGRGARRGSTARYARWRGGGFAALREAWLAHSTLPGQRVRPARRRRRARAEDVDADGVLLARARRRTAGARRLGRPRSRRGRSMLLVIDVGNTNTSLGIYEARRLRASWRLTTPARADRGRVGRLHPDPARAPAASSSSTSPGVAISNVVPPIQQALEWMCDRVLRREPAHGGARRHRRSAAQCRRARARSGRTGW